MVKDGSIIHEAVGTFGISASTSNDDTESESILQALRYAQEHPGNYLLTTDSQAVIDKIDGTAVNATRNPNIQGIRTILTEIKASPLPISVTIAWKKRMSNEFMRRADMLCR